MIELSLKGQKLAVHTPLVVAGTVDYLTVQIHRDSPEWEGLSLHVFFSRAGRTYELLTEGDFIGTDAHLNLSAGEWSVAVTGYAFENDEMVEKVTTNTIGLTVAPAPPDAGESLPYTPPSAFEQVEAIARSVRNDADAGLFNGEKGDTGDQGPIGLTPDFSIGTVSTLPEGSSATASISGTAEYPVLNLGIPKGDTGSTGETGEQGPPGQDGASITVSSNVIEYQEGSSGTTAPTGAWSASIPSVTAGNYLWTRGTTTFSDGATAVSYSVSRMGIDGSGSVVTVNGVSPDGNGNVELDADDVGALPDTYTAPVSSVNGYTGAVTLNASDVGAKPSSYSAPVDSVNGKTGVVTLGASDVGALPSSYTAPVSSVNGQTGAVTLDADDVGALPDTYTAPVDSVNGKTGAVTLDYSDVNAPFEVHVSKSLSSAGWYRVLQVGYPSSAQSKVIDLTITRSYSNSNNESHCIKFIANYNNFSFLSEVSKSNTQVIDKIRYTTDSNYGYIDIHYSVSVSNWVHIDFSIYTDTDIKATCVSKSLISVDDAPSGETVATEYNFKPVSAEKIGAFRFGISQSSNKVVTVKGAQEGAWLLATYGWQNALQSLRFMAGYVSGSRITSTTLLNGTQISVDTGSYTGTFQFKISNSSTNTSVTAVIIPLSPDLYFE